MSTSVDDLPPPLPPPVPRQVMPSAAGKSVISAMAAGLPLARIAAVAGGAIALALFGPLAVVLVGIVVAATVGNAGYWPWLVWPVAMCPLLFLVDAVSRDRTKGGDAALGFVGILICRFCYAMYRAGVFGHPAARALAPQQQAFDPWAPVWIAAVCWGGLGAGFGFHFTRPRPSPGVQLQHQH